MNKISDSFNYHPDLISISTLKKQMGNLNKALVSYAFCFFRISTDEKIPDIYYICRKDIPLIKKRITHYRFDLKEFNRMLAAFKFVSIPFWMKSFNIIRFNKKCEKWLKKRDKKKNE